MHLHKTKTGPKAFLEQFRELIRSIQDLTSVLDRQIPEVSLSASADPMFLHDLYYGFYEPDVYKPEYQDRTLADAVELAYRELTAVLPEDCRSRSEAYETAVSRRDSAASELAYESGFRTAVQMLLAGLHAPVKTTGEKAGNTTK